LISGLQKLRVPFVLLRVKTACWVGDCFVYTTNSNRLNYFVGGQVNTVALFDRQDFFLLLLFWSLCMCLWFQLLSFFCCRTLYLLGYIPRDDRVYLVDKDLNVVSFKLSLTVLEYQTAILRGDLQAASQILGKVPVDQKNKIARFLETQSNYLIFLLLSVLILVGI